MMLSRPLREALMRRCLEANAAGDQDRVNGIVALLERHWNNRAEADAFYEKLQQAVSSVQPVA